jgi:hypothetical protein
MSHEVNQRMTVQETELDALGRAVEALGGQLIRGMNSYWCYEGQRPCDHVIRVAGTTPGELYEVGLRRKSDGTYATMCDFYGRGKRLGELFGKGDGKGAGVTGHNWGQNLDGLKDRFTQEVAVEQLEADGYSVEVEELPDGTIQVTAEAEDMILQGGYE